MARESAWNRSRLVAAWIFVAVAAIVVVAVIPPVWTDRYPRATPGRAVAALFVSAVLHVLLGTWMFAIVRRWGDPPSKLQLGSLGLLAMAFGLLLLDAGSAYASRAHTGAGMFAATVALFECVGGDFVAGVLALAGVFVRDQVASLNISGMGKRPLR